jgi:hypothetical protein
MPVMSRPWTAAALALTLAGSACGDGDGPATPDAAPPPTGALELVGHSPLLHRGMNSALAIVGDHAYVGSRTDGETHADAGVLIVDISDPAAPEVVGQIGAPEQGLQGISSRELRAIPAQDLLLVLNFTCGDIHDCTLRPGPLPNQNPAAETENLRFYDLSAPTAPVLDTRFDFGTRAQSEARPHEMFLWHDPEVDGRVLAYVAMPAGPPALMVLDVSDPQNIAEVATWDPHYDGGLLEGRNNDNMLHSVGVSADGTVAYLSHLRAGVLFLDTSAIAAGAAEPALSLLHLQEHRVDWSPPEPSGAHSAVEVPGRDLVVVTDEVYPPTAEGPGCPWGWMRMVDYSDPSRPALIGEYKLPENDPAFCTGDPQARIAFTAHNTTATENLAFITWHSGGLQVVDISDPRAPRQLAEFRPTPLPAVATEDPVLGGDGVTMWSYPIIRDGLIYVVDIRNGLYVLRYSGAFEDEVTGRAYLEGNSSWRGP